MVTGTWVPCDGQKKQIVYIDGHERVDVVKHRQKFLRQTVSGGFLVRDLATSEEANEALMTLIHHLQSVRQRISSSFMMNPHSKPMMLRPYSGVELKARSFVLRFRVPVLWYQTSLLRMMANSV